MDLLALVDDFPLCCYHFIIIIFKPIIISFKYIYEMECIIMSKQNFNLNIFLQHTM